MKKKACIHLFIPALIVALGLLPAGHATAQAFTNLHNFTAINTFTNNDGAEPMGNLVLSGSTLYGTTSIGGPDSGGIVFAVQTDGTGFTNVHTFTHDVFFNYPNGESPEGGLIVSGNTLYGTTEAGGAVGWGTVFRVNTDGSSFTNLHSFSNGAGGALPRGGLVLGGNTLYGTTESGDSQHRGIVFAVNTDGTGFTNLHSFTATSANANLVETNSDGASPNRNLLLLDNVLYGTTQYGGTNGYGVIFAMNTNGTGFTTLHTFTAVNQTTLTNSDGANPFAGLILFSNRLYGTTRDGGNFGFGTVYSLNTNGTGFTTVHSFSGNAGNSWTAGLVASSNTLYGTTFGTTTNGGNDSGAMFALNTNGTGFKILYRFTLLSGATNRDGSEPWGTLILSNNALYGTTRHGGAVGEGTLFSLNVAAPAPPIPFTASPTNGTIHLMVQFTTPGVDANGNTITRWNWNFGDSSTSTAQNPMHTYITPGDYMPTLIATNDQGDTISGVGPAITALPPAGVEYTASVTNGTVPLAVQFNTSSMDSNGHTIMQWHWDFGDGHTSTAQNPSHTYTNTGSFSPMLVATNDVGGTVASFGPSPIGVTPAPPASHTLIAYYTFDDGNLPATDFSISGNDLGYPFDFGGGSGNLAMDGLFGPNAVDFDNNGGAGGSYYYISTSNLLSALSGSFSISLWLKTTQVSGSDTDDGAVGNAGIISTYYQTVIPMALTGSKLAFATDSTSQDTLHSAISINTGDYVHVVVTRDQETGQKNIYINGSLDASDVAETGILSNPLEMEIGSGNGTGFNGQLDEIQIYTGVLSATEVSELYTNPGVPISNGTGETPDLGTALNATNLMWTTGGDSDWFVETTNTFDAVSAVQSGALADSQTNWIETTIPYDGDISFYWKVFSETDSDHLTFYINGMLQDVISGDLDWFQETYSVSAGDTLRWEYSKDDDENSEGADAGWVDQVQYTPVLPEQQVGISLQIQRYDDFVNGYYNYMAYPQIGFNDPVPLTTNSVVSPDGLMFSEVWTGDTFQDNQSAENFATLDDLIYACTNGQWTLYINKDSPGEQVFHFNISISGLTTDQIPAVTVLVPANGAVDVPTNSPFQWSGPTDFSSIFVEAYQTDPAFTFEGFTSLPGSATNWPSSPALLTGLNYFFISYSSFSVPGVTFTTPVRDGDLLPISSWSASAVLFSEVFTSFTVSTSGALPVLLSHSLQAGGGGFQLSFQTQAGRSETIQTRTNLVTGTWTDVTNFTGDGSVQQFNFPTTNAPTGFFRVLIQ